MPIAASSYPPPTCNQTADVTILGASIAGIFAISSLIEGGISPSRIVLLEPGALDWRASGCSRGIHAPAFWHSFGRLHSSMGADAIRLLQFVAKGCNRMQAWAERLNQAGTDGRGANLLSTSGVFHLPASDFEQQEMLESVELLKSSSYPIEVLSPPEVEGALGFASPYSAVFDPRGGSYDPAVFLKRSVADLALKGVRVHSRVSIMRCDGRNDGAIQVDIGAPSTPSNPSNREAGVQAVIRSECLINACETNAVANGPSLAMLLASRQERLTWLRMPQSSTPLPAVIWNRGRADWHSCADGTVLITESRPSSEVRPGDIPIIGKSTFASAGAEIVAQQMLPMPTTADGLPCIGSNPFRADELLCLGFHGWGSTLAAAAGGLVAELLMNGRSENADLFSPRRLL